MYDEDLASAFNMPEITCVTDYTLKEEHAKMCYELGKAMGYADAPISYEMYRNKFCATPDFCFAIIFWWINIQILSCKCVKS